MEPKELEILMGFVLPHAAMGTEMIQYYKPDSCMNKNLIRYSDMFPEHIIKTNYGYYFRGLRFEEII